MNPRSTTKFRKRASILSVFALLVSLLGATLAVPAKAAGIELTYWSFHYLKATTEATEKIVANWNKENPNVKVKIVYVDVNNYLDKLTTSFAGGTAPDIFTSEAASMPSGLPQVTITTVPPGLVTRRASPNASAGFPAY